MAFVRRVVLKDTQEDLLDEAYEREALAGVSEGEEPLAGHGRRHPGVARTSAAVCGFAAVAGMVGLASYATLSEVRPRGGPGASVGEVVTLHFDTGALRWNPTACFDIERVANNDYVGAHLGIWECNGNINEMFIFPRTTGMIRWLQNPSLCAKAAVAAIGGDIVLGTCTDTPDMVWAMPDSSGPIRLQASPKLCILGPSGDEAANGAHVQLGDCPKNENENEKQVGWLPAPNPSEGLLQYTGGEGATCLRAWQVKEGSSFTMGWCNGMEYSQFVFPGRDGLIRLSVAQDLCVDVAGAQYVDGAALRLSKCDPAAESMLWEVPSGNGPVRLRHHPEMCLQPQKVGERAVLSPCAYQKLDKKNVSEKEKPYELGITPEQSLNIVDRPTLHGPAMTMYCVAVVRPGSYEQDIMQRLLAKAPEAHHSFGIYACDDFDVFASQALRLGHHHLKGDVWTIEFPQAKVGSSLDHFAANTELFVNLWRTVESRGIWKSFDWIVKADPDAVVLPGRVKDHLRGWNTHTPQFIENCNHWPSSKDYPQMFGALEVMSREAMEQFFPNIDRCKSSTNWNQIGEDLFMRRCFLTLGVVGRYDPDILGDQRCFDFGGCQQNWKAAYHLFKDANAWISCWETATR